MFGNGNCGGSIAVISGNYLRMCSKVEVDVKRLLGRCEEMAREDPNKDWRLNKYLEHLEHLLGDLQKQNNKPGKDTVADYTRRHLFLKGLLKTTEISSPAQKVMAVQHLPHGAAATGSNVATKEIHQKTTAKYNNELKSELFFNDTEESLRHRNILKPPGSKSITNGTEDLDSLLKYHHTMQEKVAENMLLLTRNLKEQTELANQIIKKDTQVLKTSSHLTENNLSTLKTESERLEEQTKKAWKLWLWVLIALVMVVFINMVLFMKMVKKPR